VKIEFNVTNVAASQADCERLGAVVARTATDLSVPLESIEEVIVATEDKFADIVGRFDPSKKYTNSRGLLAAGKMFTHRPAGKEITHSILLQHSVVDGFFGSSTFSVE
jgi:hypothetical protein